MVQFSHPYMTTGKTIALTIQIFVGKVMSLLFNILSRFVIAFLPRSRCLQVFVVCLVAQSRPTLCNPMDCSTPGFPGLHHLLELPQLMSVVSVMPSNHPVLCHPLLLLPSIFPSIRVFSSETVLVKDESCFCKIGGQGRQPCVSALA